MQQASKKFHDACVDLFFVVCTELKIPIIVEKLARILGTISKK